MKPSANTRTVTVSSRSVEFSESRSDGAFVCIFWDRSPNTTSPKRFFPRFGAGIGIGAELPVGAGPPVGAAPPVGAEAHVCAGPPVDAKALAAASNIAPIPA